MISNEKSTVFLLAFILFLGAALPLAAEMNTICRFNKVPIPVVLRIGDSTLPKGEYDLEFLRAIPLSYYLRIMRKGKIIHLVQGREFLYERDSVIPRKPSLKMTRNQAEKSLILIFESGSDTKIYERIRASYHIDYEED